jgi:hypothetical protein
MRALAFCQLALNFRLRLRGLLPFAQRGCVPLEAVQRSIDLAV